MAETEKELLITSSIAPWLSVQNGSDTVTFYKTAFAAIEAYRLDTPDGGLVVQLSVNGAHFWVSGGGADNINTATELAGNGNIRIILTVANPDILFEQAIAAGATVIFPVGEDHGWKLGRLVDPFGLHWEIGHPIDKK